MTLSKIYTIYGCKVNKHQVLMFLLEYKDWILEYKNFKNVLVPPTIEQIKKSIEISIKKKNKNKNNITKEEKKENLKFKSIYGISNFIDNWGLLSTVFTKDISIFQITHDVEEKDSYVIGTKLLTSNVKSYISETLVSDILSFNEKITNTKKELEKYKFLLTEYKIYNIQDDCTCCS